VYDEGPERAEAIASALQPAVGFLGRWMTLFLAPPLTMLPVALSSASARGTTAAQWRRLAAVHACGWVLSCCLSAALASALVARKRPPPPSPPPPSLPPPKPKEPLDVRPEASPLGSPVPLALLASEQPEPPPETLPATSGGAGSSGGASVDGASTGEAGAGACDLDPQLTRWLGATAAAYCLHGFVGRGPAAFGTTVTLDTTYYYFDARFEPVRRWCQRWWCPVARVSPS